MDDPDLAPDPRKLIKTVQSRDNELDEYSKSHPIEDAEVQPPQDGDEHTQQMGDAEETEEEGCISKTCSPCIKPWKRERFTKLDVLFTIGGICTFLFDIATDLILAVQYLHQGNLIWSAMTFVFVLLPSVVLQSLSFRWIVRDQFSDDEETKQPEEKKGILRGIRSWCVSVLAHVLQLGPIRRYWRFLKFGRRSKNDEEYRELLINEYRDIAMLRLFEAFLESAPQLVLQLYIMVESETFFWFTALSCVASIVSLSWALGAYHMALRNAREDKNKVTYLGVALIMMWRLFTITSRVIAMALFSAIYEWLIFVVAGVHWALMTAWLLVQKTDFTESSKCEEGIFDTIIGFIHIFCFFNMKEGRTRFRALFFYIIMFIENTIMFTLWYVEVDSREQTYGLPALILVWGGFFLGICIMMFYYRHCHPNGQMPVCVPCPRCPPRPCSPRDQPDLPHQTDLTQTDAVWGQPDASLDRVNLFYYTSRRNIHPSILRTSSMTSRPVEDAEKLPLQGENHIYIVQPQ